MEHIAEKLNTYESKSCFDPREAIESWLREGTVERVVDIDIAIPKLKGRHSNLVELVFVPKDVSTPDELFANNPFVKIVDGKYYIRGVFKPYVGESAIKKREFGFDDETHCHKREIMAYSLDKELGFDIVPPTVEKEIGGRVGSLQLFIPPKEADWQSESMDTVSVSKEQFLDYFRLALFDYIIQNPDRNAENYLVTNDQSKCYAIDHGYILPPGGCRKSDIAGPRKELLGKEVPSELIRELELFVARKDEIFDTLSESIIDVNGIYERAKELLSEKCVK